jgi:predicted alpha/beta-hydrolase family hydrolase
MLAAESPGLVEVLLLLSYPLHPPKKPEQLRTAHFPQLHTPALFVSGTKDEFATVDEMRSALALVPAKTELQIIEGAGHDLKKGAFDLNVILNQLSTLGGAGDFACLRRPTPS